MYTNRIYLFIGVFLFGLLEFVRAARIESGCSLLELDKCAARVLVYANRTSHPLDPDVIDKECTTEWENLDCIKRYDANCLEGVTSGMMKILLEGINGELESKCDTTSRRRIEYNKYIGCLNTVGDKMRQCMKLMAGYLESATEKPVKERVKLSCCSFSNYRKCLKEAAATKCDSDTVTYADSILQGIAGDLMDTVCSKYKTGSKTCAAVGTLEIPTKQKFDTLVPPLTEVLKALG